MGVRPDVVPEQTIRHWATRLVPTASLPTRHALTVDVEDYFQVEAFFSLVDRRDWDRRECRVERNVDRLLALFANSGVKATFFTLGWVAERYPSTVSRIVAEGHELASHGMAHFRADSQTPAGLLDDATRAKAILEEVGGTAVQGYRAASFSVMRHNLWAFDVLREAGYRYSSSVYPVRHDLYGIPEAPRFPFYPTESDDFIEIPVTTARRFGVNVPCGGGGYFRLLPYWFSRMNMRSVARNDRRACIFYFHPWEIDPGQPRIAGASLKTRIRHYTNLAATEFRLKRLLAEFAWGRMDQVFPIPLASDGAL